jgi:hypothetical protein
MAEDKAALREHWENRYASTANDKLGWYEPAPELSLKLISTAIDLSKDPQKDPEFKGWSVMDAGGGASRLVDNLVAKGSVSRVVVVRPSISPLLFVSFCVFF